MSFSGPVIATIRVALPANYCPVCGKIHRQGSKVMEAHAAELEARGYTGYNYDIESWIITEALT